MGGGATHQSGKASQRLGLVTHVTFSGTGVALFLPLAPHNAQLFNEAFAELALRWLPILNVFDECGVDVCYELHQGGLTRRRDI